MHNRYEILGEQSEEDDPEMLWTRLSDSLCQASEVIPQKRKRRRGNKWITDEIFDLMDQRRLFKYSDANRYKEINKQIKIKCNVAKERRLNQECAEIELLATRDTRLMHSRIAEITRRRKWTTGKAIKDKDGKI